MTVRVHEEYNYQHARVGLASMRNAFTEKISTGNGYM